VKRFDGTTWRPFDAGPRPLSAGFAQRARITFSREGTAYVAWTLRNAVDVDIVRTARADATSWTQLSEVPPTNTGIRMPDLGFAVPISGGPIVSWAQTGGADASTYAARWDGAAWQFIGNAGFTTSATFESFAFALSANGVPWNAMSHIDDTGAGRLNMQRFLGTAWIPMGLVHGRLSGLSMVLPASGPIDSPHFAWVQDGAVEVWRWTP
jgi:hypothetical protein